MRTLLGIMGAVLAAIVFSVVYLIELALESRRDRQVRWVEAPSADRGARPSSKTVP